MESISFESQNKTIQAYHWPTDNAKGVVQIIHGMAEHAQRYDRFAQFLNRHGYSVYADDHRGHGQTLNQGDLPGDLGEDGFNAVIEDEKRFSQIIKEQNPKSPLIIFGHSMGSFITQALIQQETLVMDGAILSGSSSFMGNILYAGRFLAGMIKRFSDKPSNLLDFISFADYNKKYKPRLTKFDWLSRDRDQVQKYIDDPLCGVVFPAGFYYYFFNGLINIHKFKPNTLLPHNMPLFIISGGMDPVGFYGKKVQKLYEDYCLAGMKKVELKLYEGARHELINETNYQEVFEDTLNFLDEHFITE